MTKKSVLILGPALHAVSGVSTHVKQLMESNLFEDIRFWHFQVGSEGRSESGFQKIARFIVSPLSLGAAIILKRADIVHLNTSLLPKSYWRDLIYVLVGKLLCRKLVYQVHGGSLPGEFFAGNAFLTWILRRILRQCDVVVVLARVELDAYRQFVPGKRVLLIPNAIDPGALADSPRMVRAKGVLRLAYLGRIARDKGIFELAVAMKTLFDRAINVRLAIAGSGPEEDSLWETMRSAGLEPHVRFYGPIFGEEKNEFWDAADLFLFPTYGEGLPYSLLESMARGVVPVVSAVGAIPDVVQDAVHGLLVQPRDSRALAEAVMRLDADRGELARMSGAARERIAAHYTVAKLAEEFRRLYESL